MNILRKITFSLALVCAAIFTAGNAHAGDTAPEIQTRMKARVSQIDTLKKSGVVGENNKGLLEIRQTGTKGADETVSAENRDRNLVYAILAKETGTTADAVGKARAKKIAAGSAAGVWVQDEKGNWKKK